MGCFKYDAMVCPVSSSLQDGTKEHQHDQRDDTSKTVLTYVCIIGYPTLRPLQGKHANFCRHARLQDKKYNPWSSLVSKNPLRLHEPPMFLRRTQTMHEDGKTRLPPMLQNVFPPCFRTRSDGHAEENTRSNTQGILLHRYTADTAGLGHFTIDHASLSMEQRSYKRQPGALNVSAHNVWSLLRGLGCC